MKYLRVILPVFLSLYFCGTLFSQEQPWQLKIDKEGIKVYTRSVENSPILEFKGAMTLPVERNKVVEFYENESLYPQWFYKCKEVRILEKKSDTEKIIYYVMDMPWPVSDRDSVYLREKSVEPGGDVVFRLSVRPDAYPRQAGKVRVSYLKVQWRFHALPTGETEISFQQHCSSDGHIPVPIVNKLSIQMPFKTLQKMKSFLSK